MKFRVTEEKYKYCGEGIWFKPLLDNSVGIYTTQDLEKDDDDDEGYTHRFTGTFKECCEHIGVSDKKNNPGFGLVDKESFMPIWFRPYEEDYVEAILPRINNTPPQHIFSGTFEEVRDWFYNANISKFIRAADNRVRSDGKKYELEKKY